VSPVSGLGDVTYLLTYLLTHTMVEDIVSKKPTVTQLVRKYPAFLWNPKVHYRVHTNPPLDPILSQLNLVRPIDPYPSKVHLNVILPPTPRSSQWSLAFGPPNQNPVNTSPLVVMISLQKPFKKYYQFTKILRAHESLQLLS
jgi:hypothetical protein